MAKQANKVSKATTTAEPEEYSFTGDHGPPTEEPPPDDSGFDRNHYEDAADADMDHVPDDYVPDHEGNGREANDGALISPAQLEILRAGSKRLQTSISYATIEKTGNNFFANKKVITGSKLLAILDWTIVLRTLFVNGKGVQTLSHRWIEHGNAPPKRPDTFMDREKWKNYNKDGYDPWGNIAIVVPFEDAHGGIISLQVNAALHKAALARLIETFDGYRRPIAELIIEVDPDSIEAGATRPGFKILGHGKTPKDFGFLRELLIRNDPDFPEPKASDFKFGE